MWLLVRLMLRFYSSQVEAEGATDAEEEAEAGAF
jgi:hypothetical protein